jgi:hypothetical protein
MCFSLVVYIYIYISFSDQKVVAKELTTPKYIKERKENTNGGAKPNSIKKRQV